MSGKKRIIHLGYNVLFFQTWVINKKDKSPKIGYTINLRILLASTANDTDWFKFRLFSIASFDEVAIATKAACTTP